MKKQLKDYLDKYELMPLNELKEELRLSIGEKEALENSIYRMENEIYRRQNPELFKPKPMKKTAIQISIDHEKEYLHSMMESGAGQISVEFQKERISFLENLRDTTEREQIEEFYHIGRGHRDHDDFEETFNKTYANEQ